MTPERARQLLPIIQAFSEGKNIECKFNSVYANWTSCTDPIWNPDDFTYRIAPEKKWYRVAEFKGWVDVANREEAEKEMLNSPAFIRWLTPRVYYNID